MTDTNTIATGGDVNLISVKLYNNKGAFIDIAGIFTEIELYEDIYSHALSGSITIVDTSNLIETFPIIGEETLEVVYNTPGFLDKHKVDQKFHVYKLANIMNPTPHKQIYTLYFITPESIIDLNKKVSKAFMGTSDKIIERLLKADGLNTSKKYELESAVNNIKFVSPFWTPFKCITYAASRGQTADQFKSSAFLFFETNKGYRLKSSNTLLSNKARCKYIYSNDPARQGSQYTDRSVASEMSKIYTLTMDSKFNIMERLSNGVYQHTMWNHNILLKTLTKSYYDYKSDFSKTSHLDAHLPISKGYAYGTNVVSNVTTYPQIHANINEDNYHKIMTNKVPLMNQLEMLKFDITVHGRTDVEVGDVLDLSIAGMEVLNADDKNKVLDNRYNGKYLATSILHRITPQKHQMVIQVIKESIKESY